MAAPLSLDAAKHDLRRRAVAPRRGDPAAILARLAALSLPAIVAGVWPLADEIDLRPVLHRLHASGRTILLPETPPPGQALVFRHWQPGATLLPGRYGTRHPDGPIVAPQALLVPLLAFDRACQRLGRGGGYYDRTLAAWPGVLAIGYGWAAQEVRAVPVGPHDRALDAVATERELVERAPI